MTQLGPVRNVVESDEDVANTYDYYAFGDSLAATENVTSPYRFTGRDAEPGGLSQAHYYRNRYYMPWTGIFMSRDAMWADVHRGWGYVGNNPVNLLDPYGLWWKQVFGTTLVTAGALFIKFGGVYALGTIVGIPVAPVLVAVGAGLLIWELLDTDDQIDDGVNAGEEALNNYPEGQPTRDMDPEEWARELEPIGQDTPQERDVDDRVDEQEPLQPRDCP